MNVFKRIGLFVLVLVVSVSVVLAKSPFVKGSVVEVTTDKARMLCTFEPTVNGVGWNESVGMYYPNDERVMTQYRDCTVPISDTVLSVVVTSPSGEVVSVVCDTKNFVPAYLTGCHAK